MFSISSAQWSIDPTQNNPICNEAGGQREPCMVNVENDEIIIAWRDYRNEPILGGDIYAQKIKISDGTPLWSTEGIKVNTEGGVQINPCIAADGNGGAILAWQKNNGGAGEWDIFSQRIDSDGKTTWGVDELSISVSANAQEYPKAVPDGTGGVIIAWHDGQIFGTTQIYAQRIDASGTILWLDGGALVTSANTVNGSMDLIYDKAGGVIVAWVDIRGEDEDIYCQRLDGSGNRFWGENDVLLCDADYNQGSPVIVSDDESGAYIIWSDNRAGYGTSDIFAQRVDSGGNKQWIHNGVGIINNYGVQGYHQAISDGKGGAIITWEDNAVANNADIYTQRVNKLGEVKWDSLGMRVCDVDNNQRLPEIISDGTGGAIISWLDFRYYNVTGDIYAQKIDSSGAIQWVPDGVAISTAENSQSELAIITDNLGGAILGWADRRYSPDYYIYAQRIIENGTIGGVTHVGTAPSLLPEDFLLYQNYPNPFNPSTNISYQLIQNGNVNIKVDNMLGKEVATLVNSYKLVGTHEVEFNAKGLPSAIYFYKITAGEFSEIKKMVYIK